MNVYRHWNVLVSDYYLEILSHLNAFTDKVNVGCITCFVV